MIYLSILENLYKIIKLNGFNWVLFWGIIKRQTGLENGMENGTENGLLEDLTVTSL